MCEKLSLVNEMYFAIMLDRKTAGPVGFPISLLFSIPLALFIQIFTGDDCFKSKDTYLYTIFQIIIGCSKGGTSIEDLAEKYPNMIVKVIILLFSLDNLGWASRAVSSFLSVAISICS